MLTLMEELLLISLNEDKGTFSFTINAYIDYCLAGAILSELERLKRIRLDKKTVEVLDGRPLNDPWLEKALNVIEASKKHRSPDYWVRKLRSSLKGLRKSILKNMVDKGLVRDEEVQTLVFFTSIRYPVRDIRTKKDVVDRIYRVLLRGENPNQQTLRLIGLVYGANILPYLVDKEDRKEAKKRAKELTKDDFLTNALKKAIANANAAATA